MKYLMKIDIFYQNINFTIENNSKIQTSFGGLLTLIFIGFSLFLFIQNGKELFLKKNPISFQDTMISQDYLNITIDQKNFPISFQIFDNNSNIINVTNKLDLLLQVINVTSQGVGSETSIETKNLEYNFQDPKLNNFNYIMKEDENITLSGSWNINNLVALQFSVSICNNLTNFTCDSRDEIFDFVGNHQLSFNFYYNDVNLQLTNFENPINSQIINTYYDLTRDSKYISYFMRKNKIITDSGIIFSDINTLEYTTVDSYSIDTSMLGKDGSVLFYGYFFSTNKTQIIHRSYLTLQSILSQMGGLLNLLYWVFLFLNYSFTTIRKNLIIMNAVFEDVNENEHKNSHLGIKKIIKNNENSLSLFSSFKDLQKSCYLNNSFIPDTQQPSNINLNKIKFNNFISDYRIKNRNKNIEISLTLQEYFTKILCRCNENKKFSKNLNYYNLLSKIIDYYCDIINYIRKLEDIEKLKKIVLDEQQINLFNMIKPKVRDIKEETIKKNKDVLMKMLKNITSNPRDKIDESIRKFFI